MRIEQLERRNLQGRVGDTANKEKIRTTATEKENKKERMRARAMWRMAIASGSAGSKATTMEAVVVSGHWSRDDCDIGDDGDGNDNDPIERL